MCEPTRRERKKEATRLNIMETAIRLFKQQGFEQTTMNQVSEEADVALGTLYNYFPSKESIAGFYVNWVVDQYRDQYWPKLTAIPNTYDRLKFVLTLIARWHEDNKKLAEIYISDLRNFCFGSNWEPLPKNPMEQAFIDIFEMGIQLGDVRKELQPEDLGRHLMGVLYAATLHWFADPEDDTLVKQYFIGLDIMFAGCTARDGSFRDIYCMFF